ncbi:MAG: hypothetical protein ACT4OU_10790 [Hyphomicrobium sp.]
MTKTPLPEAACPEPTPSVMAAMRVAVEKALAERTAYEAQGGPAKDLRLLRRRIAADLLVLSNICERRTCRRHRQCRFQGSPCLAAHRRDAISRFSVLAGFREPLRNADGEDEDLSW